MTPDDFHGYWAPACRALADTPLADFAGSKLIAEVLGLEYPHSGYWQEIPLTEEMKGLLCALAGPHGQTLLKVYRIRKGLVSRDAG